MSKPQYYHIQSLSRTKSHNVLKNLVGGKKQQFMTAMVGVYALLAVTAGFILFGGNKDNAQASESAFISSSLRLVDEKEYKVGDTVTTALTLQNTSLNQSVSNLKVEMFSTKNSVNWTEAIDSTTQKRANGPVSYKPQNNSFSLPVLSSGERTEFLISGTLIGGDDEFLTVLSKIQFSNREGSQEATTNRVFTKLNNVNQLGNSLLSLSTNGDTFSSGDSVTVNIQYKKPSEKSIVPDVSGKVFVSRKDLNNLVFSADCKLNESGNCSVQTSGLDAGTYSAIFIDETETIYSEIKEFTVQGSQGSFTPSNQAQISLPFGSSSVNGVVAVFAERVVNLNDRVDGQSVTFEAVSNGKVVATFSAPILQDRTASATIATAQLPAEGVYVIRLKGTDKTQEAAFAVKPSNHILVANKSGSSVFGKSINIESLGIKDSTSNPLTASQVTLGVWHPQSGSYNEVGSINGIPLSVENGDFKATLPAETFSKGGLYQIIVKTADGQISEFLAVSFNGSEVGFVDSGVTVTDYNDLKVGKSPTFVLNGIRDKSGTIISTGDCGAEVYTVGNSTTGIQLRGQIKNGTCAVVAAAGTLTEAGPILVSFTGPNISNDINQSRQFTLAPGNPTSFGGINLEYEPARIGYANTAFVGPVTDVSGNLTSVFGLKAQVIMPANSEKNEAEKVLYEVPSVNVTNGYASVILPSSAFSNVQLQVRILGSDNTVLSQKDILATSDTSKLILPAGDRTITSDKPLNIGIVGLSSSATECTFTWVKNVDQKVTQKAAYDTKIGGCQLEWNVAQYREVSQALVQIQVGEAVFSQLVEQTSGEAANMFVVTPQIRSTDKNELGLSFLSSPIVDKHKQPVRSGTARVLVNGNVKEVAIENGQAQFNLKADEMNSKDIRTILDQRYIDLNIEAKASVTSVNKYPDTSIYLGSYDIANSEPTFNVKSASGYVLAGRSAAFEFATDSCNALILSNYGTPVKAKTHWQAGSCYAEVGGGVGEYQLLFEQNGFTVGVQPFIIEPDKIDIMWCSQNPCEIQVIGSFSGSVEAVVHDGEKQFKFSSQDVGNIVKISQNGLNPLKEYPVEIQFYDNQGRSVSATKQILGEYLLSK